MKVHFDNVAFPGTGPASGPNSFAGRLARELFESGHQVVATGPEADISLVFIEPTGNPLANKIVQRLDGVWFKPSEFETRNVAIRSLYVSADAVVCQSNFDKTFVERWWGPRGAVVIHNGIDLTPVAELTIPALAKLVHDYERIYVCSSNWHPQKRLRENVDLYARLRERRPDSCLIIMGKDPNVRVVDPHVFYTGPVGPDVYMQVYAAASWMLHLAWADHCPNVVIEALSQGTPVCCASVGGTKELVGGYGHIVNDVEYDFGLADYDSPPPIDISQVIDLPDRTTLDRGSIADIDIGSVCKRYVQLFDRVLK